MKLKEKKYLSKLIDKYEKKDSTKYLLSPNSFSNEDIINGINFVFKKHDRAIILEDDLEIGKNFLPFMNKCLIKYKKVC